MDLKTKSAAHYAVIKAGFLLAEREASEAIATAQQAGEHQIAADMQELLRKLRRLHRSGDAIATAVEGLPVIAGPIYLRSGGDDKPPV